jgi:hypothetical protein
VRDINTVIAIHQGWKFEPPIIRNEHNKGYWHKFDTSGKRIYGQLSPENPPDYEHNERLYMELFEEMANDGYCPALLFDDNGRWAVSTDGTQTLNFESPCDVNTSFFVAKENWKDTIGTAICLAYIKLNGLECEE